MQFIVLVIKRLVMALCMLYTVDLITSSAGFIIPINVVSVCKLIRYSCFVWSCIFKAFYVR